jgi:hypothetical protein
MSQFTKPNPFSHEKNIPLVSRHRDHLRSVSRARRPNRASAEHRRGFPCPSGSFDVSGSGRNFRGQHVCGNYFRCGRPSHDRRPGGGDDCACGNHNGGDSNRPDFV